MRLAVLSVIATACFAQDPQQLLQVKRVFVDQLAGGVSGGQIRDMIISSLQGTKLFIITENPERADATMRGSAEDLIFTDKFDSSDSINARASLGSTSTSATKTAAATRKPGIGVTVGEHESTHISERKHEAVASVRLVNKDGDVIWSTTQESLGAKFRGASADVADKVTKQLLADIEKVKTSIQ
ncbi:MAG: hypothetical protein JWO48_2787 [Bryobacterales bacterium]|nr:hypothetical protein [Bryobacterales bacterium]